MKHHLKSTFFSSAYSMSTIGGEDGTELALGSVVHGRFVVSGDDQVVLDSISSLGHQSIVIVVEMISRRAKWDCPARNEFSVANERTDPVRKMNPRLVGIEANSLGGASKSLEDLLDEGRRADHNGDR